MNKTDKEWLEKCKLYPDKYAVSVDNDCVTVYEINPYKEGTEEAYNFDGEYYSFSAYGQEFIILLLREMGITADWC